MFWVDLFIACLIISPIMSLCRRRWLDATSFGCFAVFAILDRTLADTSLGQLKYLFLVIGVAIVVFEVLREYARYKKKLADQ